MTPQLYLGTSGFSFDDWVGTVYPERLPRSQWLAYYEQALGFTTLEVNYTYYRMPSAGTMAGMARKTSPEFKFTVKTHRSMTHDILQPDRAITDNPGAFKEYRAGLRPLVDSGKLGCILAQFPYPFVNEPRAQEYLARTVDRLADLHLVVEFRHHSWAVPQTFERLRERGVGFCAVDEPSRPKLMPWVTEATSDLGYVRFHGRNAQQWFGTSTAERYNYMYSSAELSELAQRLAGFRERVQALYVFFNNCHAGSAAKNARQFGALLEADGWSVSSPAKAPVQSRLFEGGVPSCERHPVVW